MPSRSLAVLIAPGGRARPVWWVAVVLGLLAGCEGEAPARPASSPRPVSLLDDDGALTIEELPATGLPVHAAIEPPTLRLGGRLEVASTEWQPTRPPPPALLAGLGLEAGASGWRAVPRVDLAPSAARLRHDGREVDPADEVPAGLRAWRDGLTGLVFWWDTSRAALLALGPRPPGAVTLTVAAPPGGAQAPREAASGLDALRGRLVIGDTGRRGLVLPAPSSLRADLTAHPGAFLRLVVAVAEETVRGDGAGRVLAVVDRRRPVTFSVVPAEPAGAGPLWSATLTAADGFVTARVPLGDGTGGALRLQASAPGDAATGWPTVFWGELAVVDGAPPAALHVVLIDVDTLRSDRLGCYGCERDTSPRLDAWAARRAVVYDDVMSASNWTLPSTVSMLTGLAVHQHGVLAFPAGLDERTPTLARRLSAAGWATAAIVEGGYVSRSFGFEQGFDVFVEKPFQADDWSEALAWLDDVGADRPLFLFLHTYAVHAPWAPDDRFDVPEVPYAGPLAGRLIDHDGVIAPFEAGHLELDAADREHVRRLYDAAVRRADDLVGAVLEGVEQRFDPAHRLVIVTADHGEELFARGLIEHGRSLHRELLGVPLILGWPDGTAGRSDLPASGLDLVPSVLATLGLPVPEVLPGRPLRGADAGPRLRVAEHADTARAADLDGWRLIAGMILRPVGQEGPLRLYDRRADPDERHDVAAAEPERAEQLQALLADWFAAHPATSAGSQASEVDPAVIGELRALGYLGDG